MLMIKGVITGWQMEDRRKARGGAEEQILQALLRRRGRGLFRKGGEL